MKIKTLVTVAVVAAASATPVLAADAGLADAAVNTINTKLLPGIAAVGGALIAAAATAVGFKWIKGAIFG